MNRVILTFATFVFSMAVSLTGWSADSASEVGQDLKKEGRKTWRNVKDEVCEMVNGKVECAAKKVKHKTENVIDEMKDKVDGK